MTATTLVLPSRRARRYEVTLVLAWWAIYGVFLIFAVYVMPSGAAGLVQKLRGRR
jgi:hypothetical protein